MKQYQLPERIHGLIFDMDNTLYTNDEYARHQEIVLVERLALSLGLEQRKMQSSLDAWRNAYADNHGGRRPSLGNTFLHGYGIPIETSIQWRRESIKPEHFLKADAKLDSALASLSARCSLAVVTNNPVSIAEKSLQLLGVRKYFTSIVGLDSTGKSKPNPEAFQRAAAELKCPEPSAVSIGDRFEVDLEPALAIGMGAILVDGVTDVYAIEALISDRIVSA